MLDEDDEDQYEQDQGADDPLQCGSNDVDDVDDVDAGAIVMDNAEMDDDDDAYDDDVAEYLETSVDPAEMLAMTMDSSGSQEEAEEQQQQHVYHQQQMPGVPPKRGRGRGRPRKYPQAPVFQGHSAFGGHGLYDAPVVKRGRGRPRKDGTIGGPNRRQRNRGGKRGRPRKYQEAPMNVLPPNDTLEADVMMMQEEANVVPDMTGFKRGPGRPRKSDYFVGPGGNVMLVGGTSRRRANHADRGGNKNKCPFCKVYVVGVKHFRHHLKTAHSRKSDKYTLATNFVIYQGI